MKKMNEKQPTYLVVANTDKQKEEILNSNLALVRDWKRGWFDVPHSFYEEFRKRLGIDGVAEHSVCRINITKEDIYNYNKK